jgi:hypothetical protein
MPPEVLAFNSVGDTVFRLAGWVLAVLILALLAASVRYFAEAIPRADAIVVEAMLGLDRESAVVFYEIYRGMRPANVAVAWFLAVLFGPLGAFLYLRDWQKAALALISLNGIGLWSMESWFSVPPLVIIQNREKAAAARELVPAALARAGFQSAPKPFSTKV